LAAKVLFKNPSGYINCLKRSGKFWEIRAAVKKTFDIFFLVKYNIG
jgi:hypothetical protein